MQPFTNVYYASLPEVLGKQSIYPPQREAYILQTANPRLQRQRYYVWLLLEHALFQSLQKTLPQLDLHAENNKWVSPHCYFSLSHSHNGLAVAVSNYPVGIDIQKRVERIDNKRRLLTPNEQTLLDKAENREGIFTELWTKKECVFKANHLSVSSPKYVDVTTLPTETRWVRLLDEEYAISTNTPIKIFEKIQL